MNQKMTIEQIIIPAHFHYLPVVRNFIARVATKYRFTKSELNALTISIDEAITNIIEHGYDNAPSGSITLNINAKRDRVIVELIDHGKSFDPNQVSDPDIPQYVQIRKRGGLGIFIIRKFMDDIQYATVDRENTLRLIKFRKNISYVPYIVPVHSLLKRLKEKFQFLTKKAAEINLKETTTL